MTSPDPRPHVVIIGAGFAGLEAAKALGDAPVDVTLIDRHNYHLFQPLLYQVASGLLDPSEVAHPVRAVFRRQHNLTVRLGEVRSIDLDTRRLDTDGGVLTYDRLIVATGSATNFLGRDDLATHTFGVKDLDDALTLRSHILTCFERAAECADAGQRRRWLTFVVAGAGPTGVEYSGALRELITLLIPREYPGLTAADARILLVDTLPAVLTSFAPSLRRKAAAALRRKGIELRLGTAVDAADADGITLSDGTRVQCATVIWSAGVHATSPEGLSRRASGSGRRIPVTATLQLDDHPEVSIAGDLAAFDDSGTLLPMLAPVAMQQGRHAARSITAELRGEAPQPFRYFDKGTMATIGRNVAVVDIRGLRIGGFIGWVIWLFLHLLYLVGFRSRAVVLITWGWNYLAHERPARLITVPQRRRS